MGDEQQAGPHSVLVVDDDEGVRATIAGTLSTRGFRVYEASSGMQALEQLETRDIHLVVLDIGLPDMNGLEVLTKVRESTQLPIIILSGHGDEIDRVVGLELGADDYVVKPFSARELEARINSVLRRGGATSASARSVLAYDDLVIDTAAREVSLSGTLVSLTPKEFDVLAFLAARPRVCFSREDLLHEVWSSAAAWQDDATVTEHVRRIRQKLGLQPDQQRWLVTVRGVGYRFDP